MKNIKRKKKTYEVALLLKKRGYRLGGNGLVKGEKIDCFGMLVEYLWLSYGIDLFKEHNNSGFDLHDYYKVKDYTTLFKEYLDTCFEKQGLESLTPGVLLWMVADSIQSFGIYMGDKRVMITSEVAGCDIISSRYYKTIAYYNPIPKKVL